MQVGALAIAKLARSAHHELPVIGGSREFCSIAHRRKANTNFVIAKCSTRGINGMHQEPKPILNATAPCIGARIQCAREELID